MSQPDAAAFRTIRAVLSRHWARLQDDAGFVADYRARVEPALERLDRSEATSKLAAHTVQHVYDELRHLLAKHVPESGDSTGSSMLGFTIRRPPVIERLPVNPPADTARTKGIANELRQYPRLPPKS